MKEREREVCVDYPSVSKECRERVLSGFYSTVCEGGQLQSRHTKSIFSQINYAIQLPKKEHPATKPTFDPRGPAPHLGNPASIAAPEAVPSLAASPA